MRKMITLIALLSIGIANAQVIPTQRIFEWNKAGLKTEVNFNDTVFLSDYGAVGDGVTLNDQAFQQALNAVNNPPTVVIIPNGNFYLTDPLVLPSNVLLKGQGANHTVLTFKLDSNETDLISMSGSVSSNALNLSANAATFDDKIVLNTNGNTGLNSGDYIQLLKNDSNLITSSWSLNTVGQIVEIDSLNGDSLFLNSKIRTNYPLIKSPYIKKITPIKNAGLECLKIVRKDTQTVHCANVRFNYAINCWVKGIESENCNYSHINLIRSSNIYVADSYFHHAFDYGGGGAGYGVVAMYASGECLVENNIFEHLRHSMLLQGGSNGNVFGYNYSLDPFWTGVALPSNSAGDMVLHGNYVYANLFEGNIGQNIVIDDSHGANGPYNMFFRNRANLYGIFMNNGVPTDSCSFVGNEITNTTTFLGNYLLFGNGHFEYGNNVKGVIKPVGTNSMFPTSLYLAQQPDFLSAAQFPFCGAPAVYNVEDIPSKQRYDTPVKTVCKSNQHLAINNFSEKKLSIYPNPSASIVNFDHPTSITIYNQLGVKVFNTQEKLNFIDLSSYKKGVYLVKTDFGFQKLILK
ncbi:MAG: T9SS type A sorting domain-containing protein [Flavobacteriales bacterium]|jgi:hypothetical protein|nr:T9SS type A sorting domain-containing protein [Flavobacteriales bacterium]